MDQQNELSRRYRQDNIWYKVEGELLKKKLKEAIIASLKESYPIIPHLITFLTDFNEIMLTADVKKLDIFIDKYRNDSIESISVFASGLLKDYDAVKNSLLYPKISNGPIEGSNNKIKMMRRRGFGRAGLELLNALAVLPWFYKDLDSQNQSSQAA